MISGTGDRNRTGDLPFPKNSSISMLTPRTTENRLRQMFLPNQLSLMGD
jgi:hypothetical protein